jgi:hypothetical protein
VTDPELQVNAVSIHYPVRHAPDRAGTYGGYRDKLLERLFENMLAQRLAELSQQPESRPSWAPAAASGS